MESSHSHRTIAVQHTPLWILQEVDLIKLWEASQAKSINTHDISHCSTCQKHLSGPHPDSSSSTTSTSRGASRCARCQSWDNQPQAPHQGISQSSPTCDKSGDDPVRFQSSITSPEALLEMIKSVGVTENEKEMLYEGLEICNAKTGKNGSQSSGNLQDKVDRCHERIGSSRNTLESTAVAVQYNEFGNWVLGLFDDYLAWNQSPPRALESRP